MQRVPNPLKLPVIGDPVAQSRGGSKIRSSAAACVLLAASFAAGLPAAGVAAEISAPRSAVVRWLAARRDAATFIRFLDDEASAGIATALARHDDLSLDSIASAWKEVAPINTLGMADRRRSRGRSDRS